MISGTHNSKKKRVLVAEDEPLIAALLEEELRDAGYDIIGPASDHVELERFISLGKIDAAVIDAGMVEPADLQPLVEGAVPFVYFTGYDGDGLSSYLPPALIFTKPDGLRHLIGYLSAAMAQRPPRSAAEAYLASVPQ